jgi:predicted membrane-bound spermidine synthase
MDSWVFAGVYMSVLRLRQRMHDQGYVKRAPLLNALFYSIILAEGYVVLSTELLAIRLLIPFVGNSTETLSIIIAAVLMPLAIGYYVGGQYKIKKNHHRHQSIRLKLTRNLIGAAFILTIGLSYLLLELFFLGLESAGIQNRIIQTFIYSGLFIVYPVFLLGQTVPLISHFFARQHLSEATGRMLFFSTMGSFLGSIISTLVLMSTIGLHYTVLLNIFILVLLVIVLNKGFFNRRIVCIGLIASIAIIFNNHFIMKYAQIIENNNYSTIQIWPVEHEKDARILSINRSDSSKYSPVFLKMFSYIQYVERQFIRSLGPGKSILIIGAGGFTLGLNDTQHTYTFVDVDSSLKRISETYLLKRKLGRNKQFTVMPARAFLRHTSKQYDLIVLDAYSNVISIPPQLITQEFFRSVKRALSPQGVMVFNAIVSPNFRDRYSIKLDNTLRSVFPNLNRQIIRAYDPWKKTSEHNVIYSYFNHRQVSGMYTDDHNTYFLDRALK